MNIKFYLRPTHSVFYELMAILPDCRHPNIAEGFYYEAFGTYPGSNSTFHCMIDEKHLVECEEIDQERALILAPQFFRNMKTGIYTQILVKDLAVGMKAMVCHHFRCIASVHFYDDRPNRVMVKDEMGEPFILYGYVMRSHPS